MPLRGLPIVGSLRVSALVGKDKAGFEKASFKPDRDFEAAVPALATGLLADDVALVPIRPAFERSGDKGGNAVKAEVGDSAILFDTSASRALGFTRDVERLGKLVAELEKAARPGAELTVATFDQSVDRVYKGPFSGFSRREIDLVLARRPLGATDLAGAIASLGREKAHARALLLTDGVATAGGADAAVDEAKKLRGKIDRLDVVLSGGIRDDDLAKRLARGTLEHDGVVLDGARDLGETARRIALATCSGISVDIAGASWVWPARLDGVQPGDQAFVYALLKKGASAAKLEVTLGGGVKQTLEVPAIQVEKPLLERAAANAEIARLTATRDALPAADSTRRAELEHQIVKISTTFRVVSDFTSLLVLESDADYARFGIDWRALADVLTIGDRGLALLHRSEPVVLVKEPPPPPSRPTSKSGKDGKPTDVAKPRIAHGREVAMKKGTVDEVTTFARRQRRAAGGERGLGPDARRGARADEGGSRWRRRGRHVSGRACAGGRAPDVPRRGARRGGAGLGARHDRADGRRRHERHGDLAAIEGDLARPGAAATCRVPWSGERSGRG